MTTTSVVGQPQRYRPLVQYLAALPADQARVRLSVAAIEALIGGPLPVSARATPNYWRYSLARQWAPLGFTADLDRRDGGSVTFTRRAPS